MAQPLTRRLHGVGRRDAFRPQLQCQHSRIRTSPLHLGRNEVEAAFQGSHQRPAAPALRNTARSFTTSSWRAAARPYMPRMQGASKPSMALAMKQQQKEAMISGNYADDLGLLPGTVVMPYGHNRPSWFKNFHARRQLELKRWKFRFTEIVQACYYHILQIRPRPPVEYFQLPKIARELHHEVFSGFARGKMGDNLRAQICPGLMQSLISRARQRQPGVSLHWTVHRHLSAPKVVSYKAAVLPGPSSVTAETRNTIVQAVVRVRTLQSLRHVKEVPVAGERGATELVQIDDRGRPIEAPWPSIAHVPEDAKEVIEYMVMQKTRKQGRYSPWMVWGMTEETPLAEITRREQELRAQIAAAAKQRKDLS